MFLTNSPSFDFLFSVRDMGKQYNKVIKRKRRKIKEKRKKTKAKISKKA